MSIMDMFKSAAPATPVAATPTPAPTPATPGQIPPKTEAPTNVGDGTAPNGVVPAGADKAPLDEFKTMWDPVTPDPNATPPGNMFNVDPKKLMEAAGKIDFAKVVTPEQLTAISKGGEDATKAFAAALNSVSQTVYAQSSFATTKIVEQAIAQAQESFKKSIPDLIKSHSVRDQSLIENPALSHPAAQPVVQAIQAQLQIKYPNATTAELRSMTSKYFDGLLEAAKPPGSKTDTKGAAKGETDWSTFL